MANGPIDHHVVIAVDRVTVAYHVITGVGSNNGRVHRIMNVLVPGLCVPCFYTHTETYCFCLSWWLHNSRINIQQLQAGIRTAQAIGNESVPIQLTQCWFPGLAVSNAKIKIYFSNELHETDFIKQHSETVMV